MNDSPVSNEVKKQSVYGVQTGLAVVREPREATDYVTLRSVTWDGHNGRMDVQVIGLSPQDVRVLRDALNDILGDF